MLYFDIVLDWDLLESCNFSNVLCIVLEICVFEVRFRCIIIHLHIFEFICNIVRILPVYKIKDKYIYTIYNTNNLNSIINILKN